MKSARQRKQQTQASMAITFFMHFSSSEVRILTSSLLFPRTIASENGSCFYPKCPEQDAVLRLSRTRQNRCLTQWPIGPMKPHHGPLTEPIAERRPFLEVELIFLVQCRIGHGARGLGLESTRAGKLDCRTQTVTLQEPAAR